MESASGNPQSIRRTRVSKSELLMKLLKFASVAVLVCACLATAQTTSQTVPHPNFSGRWRMLKDKSDFGNFSRPDMVVRVIDQRGSTLNLHTIETTKSKTSVADLSYFTDGSTATNVRGGRQATSTAFWDGPALVIRTATKDSKDENIRIVETWTLSSDRQTLTTTSDITTPTGEAHLTLVSQREEVK